MKTQTKEEILMDYLKGEKGKRMSERYAIIAAMEFYHQQQLKISNIPAVMQQSEQLKAFLHELTLSNTRNFIYVQNKAKELLKSL